MLIYINERRITIPTDSPIIDSIHIIDDTYQLDRFENRNQIVIDESGKRILDLNRTPNELGLNPESTIYIINPLDQKLVVDQVEIPKRPEEASRLTIEGVM